jgi:uncharacterized protein
MEQERIALDVRHQLSAVHEAFNPAHLNLILFPTEQCNFRCTYCYEDFEIGKMSPGVVGGIKALLDARIDSLTSLVVSWFGGEPLLAPKIIRTISDHIKSRAHDALDYRANITTNGYLLSSERFEELLDSGVRLFQISLDGYGPVHDTTRRRADGAGTFERIWSNLKAIRRSTRRDFAILLRVHFFPDNRSHLEGLARELNLNFRDDERFQIYFKDVGKLGGPNDASFSTFSSQECRSTKEELDRLIQNRGQVYTLGAGQPYVCYAAQANSIAIRADGSLAKCTVALNDDRNRLGHITDDGLLKVDTDKWRIWLAGFSRGEYDWSELACPYDRMHHEPPPPQLVVVKTPDLDEKFNVQLLLAMLLRVSVSDMMALWEASQLRARALALSRAGHAAEAQAALDRAHSIRAAAALSEEASYADRSFQAAATAYLQYKTGDYSGAEASMLDALDCCRTLRDRFGYAIEGRRILLARHVVRVRSAAGRHEDALEIADRMVRYIDGDTSSWPFPEVALSTDPDVLSVADRVLLRDHVLRSLRHG